MLNRKFGITAALDDDIAGQHITGRHAIGVELGHPRMRGAQQFQPGIGGDQLHHRGGVQRQITAMHEGGLRGADVLHKQANAGFGDACTRECLCHGGRQLRQQLRFSGGSPQQH